MLQIGISGMLLLWDTVRVDSVLNFVEFDLADWKMLLVVPMMF